MLVPLVVVRQRRSYHYNIISRVIHRTNNSNHNNIPNNITNLQNKIKTITTTTTTTTTRRTLSNNSQNGTKSSAAAQQQQQQQSGSPTPRQLRLVALRAGIPMVGFGFMDNIVMITAGDAIDMTLGVTFALSTLTAAGFGQCISDVAGLTCGGIVDAAVSRLSIPHHNLTPTQLSLKTPRIYNTVGGCIGVVIGCLLGMTTLLFKDTDKADRLKKARELQSIFETVIANGQQLTNAEISSLWMLSDDKTELWTRVATTTSSGSGLSEEVFSVTVMEGIVGYCVRNNVVVNVRDAYEDERFDRRVDEKTHHRTRSVLAVPVVGEGEGGEKVVLGAIQMINKKRRDETDGVFDETDVKLVKMLSLHVSSFIKIVHGR